MSVPLSVPLSSLLLCLDAVQLRFASPGSWLWVLVEECGGAVRVCVGVIQHDAESVELVPGAEKQKAPLICAGEEAGAGHDQSHRLLLRTPTPTARFTVERMAA